MAFTGDLLRKVLAKELKEVTQKTRSALEGDTKDLGNDEGDYRSGEKLRAKIEFVRDQVLKHLGREYIDSALLQEADTVMRTVSRQQRQNLRTLLGLLSPVFPALSIAIPCCMAAQALQSVYYQIGRWQLVGEHAVAGDQTGVNYALLDLGLGHIVIWFFEILCDSYSARAAGIFGQRVRSGVMKSLVQQDYEYFDKNSAGVLQERLNRDAEELGTNFIELPREILGHVACIFFTIVQVWAVCPTWMFFLAVSPLPIITFLHYKVEKIESRLEGRGRKLAEEAAANTAEVLKEIRTVRQFACERKEAADFAAIETLKSDSRQKTTVNQTMAGHLFGVIIVSGLLFTEYIGAGLVSEGKMTPGLLFDITIKLNFWVIFRVRELLSMVPRLRRAVEPLGRVCELLRAAPHIEQSGKLRPLTIATRSDLEAALANMETNTDASAKGRERLVLCQELVLSDGLPPLPKGCAVMSFECEGEERLMFGKTWFSEQNVTFPLTMLFSHKKVPTHFDGRIEFDNVDFRYPTELRKAVLNGLSFTVEPGQKVALVGEAGCGKSSCMALLQRLYDPIAGEIRLDGVPLPEYNVNFLRSRVVIVDQKPVLFASSVRDNITYGLGRAVDDEQVIQVLRDASLWEGENGIKNKPDQILTKLGSGGISLSGGQTQRVSIARAMIRNPDVILLDEATSALDNKNEKIVQEALDRLARRGSALVIAHRLTTIKDADKIVVMRKGVLAEQGTHSELLARPIVREMNDEGEQDVVQGIYRFLWELQFHTDVAEDVTIAKTLKELDSEEANKASSDENTQDADSRQGEAEAAASMLFPGSAPESDPYAKLEHMKNRDAMLRRLRHIVTDTPCLTPTGICLPPPCLERWNTA
eukprot:gnl/TRDRNA2_/TRDRNA2_44002_c0_seq1.p1 gnl/TRDRNA2_/TRDRNA2_44002_c0~~gnl/TRDRNA2_/TRDRNA2_44002_c0_seq1.p1  ORF type:complete len:1022 (+),score=196.51 gnl/TRDRNA2_/TRDRNA2_44002_c0_seq1:453-3068(+)